MNNFGLKRHGCNLLSKGMVEIDESNFERAKWHNFGPCYLDSSILMLRRQVSCRTWKFPVESCAFLVQK